MELLKISLLTLLILAISLQVEASVPDPLADISNDCKYTLKNTSGTFKTPNFPNNYPFNKRCGYIVESPEAAADITINFDVFELEYSKRCSEYDYVMIFKKGNGQPKWEKIGQVQGYCGKNRPGQAGTVSATTKRVLVKFVSDTNQNFKGFNASFTIEVTSAKPKITCLSALGDATCNRTVITKETAVISVQCLTEALPPATYEWFKVINSSLAEDIPGRVVKNQFPNGSIQFHNLEMTDSGLYICNATNKNGVTSGKFELVVKEKCTCPKEIHTNWYDYPPYTPFTTGDDDNGNPNYQGIFYAILGKMVKEVCGTCAGGHGESEIIWNYAVNKKKQMTDAKNDIEDHSKQIDISFPIAAGKLDDKYRDSFWFLPTVESPGVAFILAGAEPGAGAMGIFTSILGGWPILLLTVVLALLAGIVMWFLDTYWNEEQFPRTFADGIIEGAWWAFVTMTTVGYGDIAPVGVPGRVFAIFWILTGLVIIAIFTGVITTSLTVLTMENDVKLYGTKAGAINNTAEFRLGVIRNADMKNYSNFDEMGEDLKERGVAGVLVDAYVAAHNKGAFDGLRVNNIIKSAKAYGFVLGRKMSEDKVLYDKFSAYLENRKQEILNDIEANTNAIEEPENGAMDILDPKNPLFQNAMYGCAILMVVLTVGGLSFEYGYLRPRHRMIEAAKNLEMVDSVEAKEMHQKAKLLKETLLAEVSEFYDRWSEKLGNLTKKHKEEQKKLMSQGTSNAPVAKGVQNQSYEDEVGLDAPVGSEESRQETGF